MNSVIEVILRESLGKLRRQKACIFIGTGLYEWNPVSRWPTAVLSGT